MKKFLSFIILFIPLSLFSQVYYKFEKEKPVDYSFQLSGRGSLIYPGVSEEKFNISIKGNLRIETIEIESDFYNLKIIPNKTFIKLEERIIEDLTKSETDTSSVISPCIIKMKKNGEIIEVEEIKKGLISLSQILNLFPIFPEGPLLDKKWKQKISAFELPGIPMCNLEFEYLYEKKENYSEINLLSNQSIKETKKEKDIKINFVGKNNSKGKFIFDEKEGKIINFNGNFSLDLNINYEIPSPTEKKVEKVNTKILLNLTTSFSKIDNPSSN